MLVVVRSRGIIFLYIVQCMVIGCRCNFSFFVFVSMRGINGVQVLIIFSLQRLFVVFILEVLISENKN